LEVGGLLAGGVGGFGVWGWVSGGYGEVEMFPVWESYLWVGLLMALGSRRCVVGMEWSIGLSRWIRSLLTCWIGMEVRFGGVCGKSGGLWIGLPRWVRVEWRRLMSRENGRWDQLKQGILEDGDVLLG